MNTATAFIFFKKFCRNYATFLTERRDFFNMNEMRNNYESTKINLTNRPLFADIFSIVKYACSI